MIEEEKVMDEDGDQIMEEPADDEHEIDSDGTETTIGDLERSVSIFVSIYQIYNENVNDLLRTNSSANLQIRQDTRKNYYV